MCGRRLYPRAEFDQAQSSGAPAFECPGDVKPLRLRRESVYEGHSMSAHPKLVQAAKTVSLVALPILAIAFLPAPPDATLVPPAHAAATRRSKSKKAVQDFTYTVSDCHGAGELDSIRLELSEGAVAFNQVLTMNCIAATRPSTVKLSYGKKGRNLEVSIILRSDVLSDCTCPIGIEGTISHLAKGDYRISFVFDHKLGASPDEKPTRQALATKEFSIP
jgi:hypothetical protein